MAEHKNPSLAELNEAIAKEHGIDPVTLKDYKLPEATGKALEVVRAADVDFGRPLFLRSVPNTTAQPAPALETTEMPVPEAEQLLGGLHATQPRSTVIPITTKATSNFAWTPRQLLVELLADIDSGKSAPDTVVVVMATQESPDVVSVDTWRARCTRGEEYYYLGIAQSRVIERRE